LAISQSQSKYRLQTGAGSLYSSHPNGEETPGPIFFAFALADLNAFGPLPPRPVFVDGIADAACPLSTLR
jgi:hypothetical protein